MLISNDPRGQICATLQLDELRLYVCRCARNTDHNAIYERDFAGGEKDESRNVFLVI